MGKEKLRKIREVGTFQNVFQYAHHTDIALRNAQGNKVELKGKWASDVFGNDKPLVLELACGKGEYTLALAQKFPDKNFVGIDIKGARIWKGAGIALGQHLHNVRFVRTNIEFLENYFAANEVDEIWITFPDPYPREKHEKRRLTSPDYLSRYKRICKPAAVLHLKTDSLALYEYSLEALKQFGAKAYRHSPDIYPAAETDEVLSVKTHYENLHLAPGHQITYIQFGFK